MPESYKECICCSLPYIDEVNGREGCCDFCTEFLVPAVAPLERAEAGFDLILD